MIFKTFISTICWYIWFFYSFNQWSCRCLFYYNIRCYSITIRFLFLLIEVFSSILRSLSLTTPLFLLHSLTYFLSPFSKSLRAHVFFLIDSFSSLLFPHLFILQVLGAFSHNLHEDPSTSALPLLPGYQALFSFLIPYF